jgi:hypothetical protein
MGKKVDDVCRLAFLNVDTFPALVSDPKNWTTRATFKKWQIDVWGWVEINVNWLLVKQSDKLEYRCKEWFESTAVVTANNKTIKDHMKLKRHQLGGTALVERGKLVHNMGKKGVDETGLGRWCWMKFVGKNSKSTMIVSDYVPHQPTGPESVGSQHRRYFNSVGRTAIPVDAFCTDLSRLIRKWTESGESVVLLADWNADVRGEKTRKYMADLGMREGITDFHGDAGPRTYNRGSTPIDGIFMTQVFI